MKLSRILPFDAGKLHPTPLSKVITPTGETYGVYFDRWAGGCGRRSKARIIVEQHQQHRDESHSHVMLLCDVHGNYYGHYWNREGIDNSTTLYQKLTGAQALAWAVEHLIPDRHFADELRRAISHPEFEFMPAITPSAARKKARWKRKKGKPLAAGVVAVQLQLATALCAVVEQLNREPELATLSEAQRTVSKLHQALHSGETFRQISQSSAA